MGCLRVCTENPTSGFTKKIKYVEDPIDPTVLNLQ